MKLRLRNGQRGAVAVEFAMVAILFVTLLMAITGFAHWMYTLEMVADAMRTGARMAVVCDIDAAKIKTVVASRVPQLSLTAGDISLQYFPAGCGPTTCLSVQVSISGATYQPWIPVLSAPLALPPFTTSLPRESLQSVNAAGETNPVCA